MTKSEKAVIVVIAVLIAGIFAASFIEKEVEERYVPRPNIRGMIELGSVRDTSASLVVGYNYFLLKKYASDNQQTIAISVADRRSKDAYIDSLRRGALDILVLPYRDSIAIDSVIVSAPIDSTSVWLMRHDDYQMMNSLHEWIEALRESPEYEDTRSHFLIHYNPFKFHQNCGHLSPYDDIIRKDTEPLGMDWRLLAALMYKESRFHIDALSRSGASGLMQMMPATARIYGIENNLDPEANIAAGAKLLEKLMRRYKSKAANVTERFKFAVAAYNAGVGKIDDCIRYAEYRGVDTGWWDNVANVIPDMNDENIAECGVVKLGPFKGVETIGHVSAVMSIYRRFCAICSE